MKYTLIADSSCDLFAKDLKSNNINFYTVPLTIMVGDTEVVDNENLNTKELVKIMKANKQAPKTACPSPEAFAAEMRKGDNVICVTLTSKLSGTYNSARLAAETVKAESPKKNIFVLDSLSTSAAMILLLNKLKSLIEQGNLSFNEIVEKITLYRNSIKLRFLLQDLGNLVKTERMSKVASLIAATLLIKPVFGDNGEGEIKLFSKCIGTKKALATLSEFVFEKVKDEGKDIPVVITHCHNEEEANLLKTMLKEKYGLTNIKTFLMRGLASFYANDKGILIAF